MACIWGFLGRTLTDLNQTSWIDTLAAGPPQEGPPVARFELRVGAVRPALDARPPRARLPPRP